MVNAYLRHKLKGLRQYQITSVETFRYNCLAWAVGDDSRWWESGVSDDPSVKYYWPAGVPEDDSLRTWMTIFALHGYVQCQDGDLEGGFLKVAIYGTGEDALHVARQQVAGNWTSKLGPNVDIEHESWEELQGDYYGTVLLFMKRPIVSLPMTQSGTSSGWVVPPVARATSPSM